MESILNSNEESANTVTASVACPNGGRPTSLDVLGIRKEDIWNLAVEGLSNTQIAKRLSRSKGGISVRTIAKYRAEMPPDYKAQFDDFDKLPQLPQYLEWMESKFANQDGKNEHVSNIKKIWSEVWRKPLESLTEQDIVSALNWIKREKPNGEFRWILSIRYLIRFGVGQQAWLTRYLSTKGKKNPSRMPAILKTATFYDQIFPQIEEHIKDLSWLSERQKAEFSLVIHLKTCTGIRTGDRQYERELWGVKLSAGKSNLTIQGGKIIDWIVFAKKKEVWTISHLPPYLKLKLLDHVSKFRIRQGEPLIQDLKAHDANKALGQICEKLQIEKLRLHDLRKVYLTGLCLAGIPLETAVGLNVGWKDLNTAREHYLAIKSMNADQEYEKFCKRFFK